jgi:hypothetical protein
MGDATIHQGDNPTVDLGLFTWLLVRSALL